MTELEGSVSAKGAELPSSDSLVTLVDQALQAGDDTLLENCLLCENDSLESWRKDQQRMFLFRDISCSSSYILIAQNKSTFE
jgi:hypothetical protein